ncbi:non-ribosomal peptide synthetase [Chitinivorax sp. B]|uniref:non-ribosomal peptide synthetase n=1 Tax=Chitinivorax sp. B TaxID=2502235 RepID=UPI0010F49060|nr:non-ribosomal peptide synthetase [Chitinivorax sp. B]
MNILLEFSHIAARYPDQIAIEGDGIQVSYRALLQDVARVQQAIVEQAGQGRMVVTLLPQQLGLVQSALGIFGAGRVFVPVDPAVPVSRLMALLSQIDMGLIVTERRWLSLLDAALADAPRPPVLLLDELGASSACPDWTTRWPAAEHAYLYFTSGSTGTPKGVLGRTDSLLQFIRWESKALQVTLADRVSMLTAQMFDPFLRDLLLPLLNGATLCLPPSRDLVYTPAALLAWFDSQRISITHMIPSLFQILLEQPTAAQQLRSLRVGALAGEMLKGSLVDKFYALDLPEARLVNLYGPTETTLAKLCHAVTEADRHRTVVPVGRPIDAATAYVVDAYDQPLTDDSAGEVLIATPYMSAGYLQAEAADKARFFNGRGKLAGVKLYRTGDIGRRLADGNLELIGRKDFQIKIDGQRIEPGEIESLLERHNHVQQAIVQAVKGGAGQTVLVAYLKLKPAAAMLDRDGWQAFLAQYLIPAAIPGHFRQVDSFPMLPNGKIDRKALQPGLNLRASTAGHEAPTTLSQCLLAGIWQQVLAVDAMGLQDGFFELGGTSLLAIRMLAQIQAQTGVAIPFADFFQAPTLSALDQYLATHQADANLTWVASGRHHGKPTQDQQRIFFHQHLQPDSIVYNMAYVAQWQGPLALTALQQAMDGLVARHAALRTRFWLAQGEVQAAILPATGLVIQHQQRPDESAAQATLLDAARQPFDLAQGELLRVTVINTGPATHWLGICLHHIAGDAWSFNQLWSELQAAYSQALEGQPTEQSAEPLTLLDVADWQAAQSASPALVQARQYWQQQLRGQLPVAQLPYDHEPSPTPSQRGARFAFCLPADLSRSLASLANRHGVTLYMTLLAALTAFLQRYTQQRDVLIGTPVANRQHPALAELVGFFVNILVIRNQVSPGSHFLQLLGQVRQTTLDALRHQTMPFDTLVELLNPPRSLGVSPLFQVMFAYQGALPAASRIGPVSLSAPEQLDIGTAKYDLTLEMWDDGIQLQGVWEYAADRFDADTLHRMAANFEYFVAALVAMPEQDLATLPLVSPSEQTLLAGWNDTAIPFSDDCGIHQLIEQQAARTPDAIAVMFEDQVVNYRELDERANQLAHHLVSLGVKPGVTVGISIQRSIELVVGFLAILKAGGIYVPVDPDYPLERRRFMMEDAGLHLLLTQSQFAEVYQDTAVSKLYVDRDAAAIAAWPIDSPAVSVTADDIAYIIYTSGSTGRPKGVLIRHRGVCNLAEAEIDLLGMGAGSRVLQFASFSFDTSIWEIVMTLCAGSALVMAPAMSLLPGPDLLAQLKRFRVTHVTLPASALAALPEDSLPDLAVLIVAGEACGLDLLQKWSVGRRFVNSYGPTEATVSATNAILPSDASRIHIGQPLHNTQIHLLDEQLQPVPIGVAGELYIGGIGLAVGYHQRPDLTAERFIVNPLDASGTSRLYRTGDLARWLPDGNIDYLGRIDQQVKLRGFRVELGEIETVLRSHPQVIDAVAMVRADYQEGGAIVGYLLVEPGVPVDVAAILDHVRASLPAFMVPAVLVPMTVFPRLPNNKVDRKLFPSPSRDGQTTQDKAPPQGEVEQAIAAVWCSLLRRDGVSRDASFFDLGGHSLLAAKAVALLASEHQLALTVRDVFEQKTVAALAERARPMAGHSTLDPLLTAVGPAPLSFAQQRMWFIEQLSPAAAAYTICTIKYLHGKINLGLLCRSLDRLFSRHAVFNTRLQINGGLVSQHGVCEPARYQIETLGGLSEASWQAAVQEVAQADAAKPFELVDQPLYRLRVLTASPSQCALVLTAHHLLLDEASLALLDDELVIIYQALQAGQEPNLPPSPISYAGFARWDRSLHRQAQWQPQLAYWQSVFATLPPVLTLPTDFPRDAQASSRAGCKPLQIDADTTQAIRQLAKHCATTPFNVLLMALQVLLHRYSGERDITIGVPVSVRPLPQLEHTVGLFLNTLALRGEVVASQSVHAMLTAVRDRTQAALVNKEVPFDKVVDAVDTTRDRATESLFQVMLAFTGHRASASDTTALQVVNANVDTQDAKFDLTLFIDEGGHGFTCKFEYRASLFLPATIQRLADHFQRLLQAMVSAPDLPVGELPMLSAAEQQLILQDWNNTAAPIPAWCAHQQFEAQVRHSPDAIACHFNGQRLSYRQLNQRANRLARQLRAAGIGTDSLVGLFLKRSDQLVVAILAVLKTGAAYLPIDAGYPAQRIAFMLADSAAAIVLTQDALLDTLPAINSRTWSLDQLESQLMDEADNNLDLPVSQQDLAYVIYTSGSTGQPKGVMMSHRGLTNYLAHAVACYDRPEGIGNPMHSSIAFDATITSLYVPLITGKQLFIVPEDNEIEQLGAVWSEQAALTLAKITPAHVELLSKTLPTQAASHTAVLVLGGEALHANALRFWRDHAPAVRVINEYGPTEATVGCCIYDVAAGDCTMTGAVPIGRPIRNTQLYVLDEALQPVPVGAVGELYIGGAGLARGYLNRPDLTAERFIRHPFSNDTSARLYKTGDLVRYAPDGNLHFLGRKDHQIKLRGFRIELGEIDAALCSHPLVEAAAALIQARHGRKHLVAYTVLAGGITDTAPIRAHLASHLPAYMVPSDIVVLPMMPLTANGKIDRDALARIEPAVSQVPQVAASSAVEQVLVDIWQTVLQRSPVGIHDNFFELGGDSILSLQIVFKARQAGFNLNPRMMFDYQTIAELASVLDDSPSAGAVELPAQGHVPLTPIQHWFFQHNQANPHHFNQSYLFDLDPAVDLPALEGAFAAVLQHHEGLRTRYQRRVDGQWQGEISGEAAAFRLQRCRLPLADTQSGYLRQTLAQCQRELNIASGPMLKALYLYDDHKALLMVVVHHLVIDGVSWRILLDDLLDAYVALRDGRQPALPARTASFQRWAQYLTSRPQAADWPAQHQFWHDYLARPMLRLPRDLTGETDRHTVATSRKHVLSLNAGLTQALLGAVPATYHANAADLLLAALAAALQGWLGDGELRVDLEGHGRDGWLDAPDVSRTLGWFTTLYPVVLNLDGALDASHLIKGVKEAVRQLAQRDAAFGLLTQGPAATLSDKATGELCFNYLGRFEQSFQRAPLLGVSTVSTGSRQSAENHRAYLLEVDAYVYGDSLTVEWTYSETCHREATIRALAEAFQRHLTELVAHCQALTVPQYTPSDFPLATLRQPALDQLQSHYPQLVDIYPLTAMQEGMVFHALNTPQSSLYVEQLCFHLTEAVEPVQLQAAWRQVAQRHPLLRSCFDLRTADSPLQIVLAQVEPVWQVLDWTDRTDADSLLADWRMADLQAGFDLQTAPLYRVTLIRLPHDLVYLVLSHHHAILDGWSVQRLLDEVTALVRGQSLGGQPRPFRDYLQWQHSQRQASQRHWQQRLAGLQEATPLPAPRAMLGTEDGIGRVEFALTAEQDVALAHFARRHRLTLSTLVQGAWALLLNRYGGTQDCLFGVTVSGRANALRGIENMVGLFIGTVPARVNVAEDLPVVGWLQQIQAAQLENEQHAGLSLADIKQQAGIDWPGALFDSIVVFENYPGSQSGARPLFLFDQAAERTNFPLTVVASPQDGLHGHLHYDLRYYTAATAAQLMRHLTQLIVGLAQADQATLGEVAMLQPDEQQALLACWAPQPRPFFDGCAQALFEQQARATPDAIAVQDGDTVLRYAELDRQASQLAAVLRQQGIGRDRLVGIYLRRSASLVVAMLASWKAGGAYLPIDAAYPAERVAYLLNDSQAAVLITDHALQAILPGHAGTTLLMDALPQAASVGIVNAEPTASDLAYVIYTSGSTGQPKGVMIEQRGLVNYLQYACRAYRVSPHSEALLHSSISFDATITSLWVPLMAGGRVVVVPDDADATTLATHLQAAGDSQLLKITPVHLELLGQTLPAGAAARVSAMVVGGEALKGAALATWQDNAPAIRIFNEYGPTETVVGCCVHEFGASQRHTGHVPIGQPIDNTCLYVLDAALRPVPFGAVGELYIGGAGVARGYLNRPALTQERFIDSPFVDGSRLYKTGDLVRALADGNLDYVGRRDQQIKLRGYRIELGEIEAQLADHPTVRQAAVIVRRDGEGADGQYLVAYLLANDDVTPDNAVLRDFLKTRLPAYMVPTYFVWLPALPQTANGKVDYKALPKPEQVRNQVHRAPGNEIEQGLWAIWREVLALDEVGIDDSFFELGGHSLKALRVMARITQQLGVAVTVQDVFDKPTIAELAALIAVRRQQEPAKPVSAITRVARAGRQVVEMDVSK